MILAFLLFALSSNAQIGLQSDLNHDKKVNISDVSLLIGFILNNSADAAVTEGLCPNSMHPHLIDLGLTSGTKWACCNVGANNPFQYGDYFAWGEVTSKNNYSMNTYVFYHSGDDSWISLRDDIAKTNWDAAYVQWGTDYKMPSQTQFQELGETCTSTWTTINGINGLLFTTQNGNKVFLPAAGLRHDYNSAGVGSYCHYWSSTQHPTSSNYAYKFYFDTECTYYDWITYCIQGNSVRPVSTN